jgi:hypothetical protein
MRGQNDTNEKFRRSFFRGRTKQHDIVDEKAEASEDHSTLAEVKSTTPEIQPVSFTSLFRSVQVSLVVLHAVVTHLQVSRQRQSYV